MTNSYIRIGQKWCIVSSYLMLYEPQINSISLIIFRSIHKWSNSKFFLCFGITSGSWRFLNVRKTSIFLNFGPKIGCTIAHPSPSPLITIYVLRIFVWMYFHSKYLGMFLYMCQQFQFNSQQRLCCYSGVVFTLNGTKHTL